VERDTTPEAARIQADVQRRLGPARRLDIAFAMSEGVRTWSANGCTLGTPNGTSPICARHSSRSCMASASV
jgi:hypothetical protein